MSSIASRLSQFEKHRAAHVSEIDAGPQRPGNANIERVPTLEPSVTRKVSPMLRERFGYCAAWLMSGDGDWLTLVEMKEVAQGAPDTDRMRRILDFQRSSASDWQNDAGGLFLPGRLSLFAGDSDGLQRIYLVWFDYVEEPELWVYNSNGEARYRDLGEYLEARLAGDLSAFDRRWKLVDNTISAR